MRTSLVQKRYLQSYYAGSQKRYPGGYYAVNGVKPRALKCTAQYRQERCHLALSLHRLLFLLHQFPRLNREIHSNKRHISPLCDLYEQITPEEVSPAGPSSILSASISTASRFAGSANGGIAISTS